MSQPKQIKRNKSLEKINDINYYCFPFYLDKNNDYVCIFKKHQQDENMKTKNTRDVYRYSQGFIYECLQETKNREFFHQMVFEQLKKKGLLSQISNRSDILKNTFEENETNQNNNQSDGMFMECEDDKMEEIRDETQQMTGSNQMNYHSDEMNMECENENMEEIHNEKEQQTQTNHIQY